MNTRRQSEQAKESRKKAGLYIKVLRERAELTQVALAKLLGYEWYTFVSQIESGANRVPSEAMEKWARALKVDPVEFTRTLLSFYDPHIHSILFPRA